MLKSMTLDDLSELPSEPYQRQHIIGCRKQQGAPKQRQQVAQTSAALQFREDFNPPGLRRNQAELLNPRG
ncbi:MAG: hypothetical protein BWY63_03782 [Chloroflexi bacterium ADurb.Bin360]|nr:MAG: hypothetical protein BWY63_03782 [Chloroflexi bacterium ADurb.Bin360]